MIKWPAVLCSNDEPDRRREKSSRSVERGDDGGRHGRYTGSHVLGSLHRPEEGPTESNEETSSRSRSSLRHHLMTLQKVLLAKQLSLV